MKIKIPVIVGDNGQIEVAFAKKPDEESTTDLNELYSRFPLEGRIIHAEICIEINHDELFKGLTIESTLTNPVILSSDI